MEQEPFLWVLLHQSRPYKERMASSLWACGMLQRASNKLKTVFIIVWGPGPYYDVIEESDDDLWLASTSPVFPVWFCLSCLTWRPWLSPPGPSFSPSPPSCISAALSLWWKSSCSPVHAWRLSPASVSPSTVPFPFFLFPSHPLRCLQSFLFFCSWFSSDTLQSSLTEDESFLSLRNPCFFVFDEMNHDSWCLLCATLYFVNKSTWELNVSASEQDFLLQM